MIKTMTILEAFRDPIVWAPTVFCVLSLAAYHNFHNVYNYWPRRGVKGLRPLVPILPEIWYLFAWNRLELMLERTRKFGKVYGIFSLGLPQLMVCDPEVIKQITIRDFDTFHDHQTSEWASDYLKNSLLLITGEHWRRVRALMTPTFTSTKIKRMFRLLEGCAQDLVANLSDQLERARKPHSGCQGETKAKVDLYELFGMYAMDGITTCCYGIKLRREESLEKASSRNAFVRDASKFFEFKWINFVFIALMPKFFLRLIGAKIVPDSQVEPLARRVEQLVKQRQAGQAAGKYDDLLQLLIDARLDDKMELNEMDSKENHHAGLSQESLLSDQEKLVASTAASKGSKLAAVKLDDFEILAESMFLLAAGLDTTRASLTSAAYFLAHNPEVQERLHEELSKIAISDEKGQDFRFDYEALTSCDYLDACISETLRLFGPVTQMDRKAVQPYHIDKYNIHLPEGGRVILGFYSLHNDPDYWHEPERFRPERFLPAERDKIVPGSYVPFGMGPRHCIGMRFSLTETKLALGKLLMRFKFEPVPGSDYPPRPRSQLGIMSVRNPLVYVSER